MVTLVYVHRNITYSIYINYTRMSIHIVESTVRVYLCMYLTSSLNQWLAEWFLSLKFKNMCSLNHKVWKSPTVFDLSFIHLNCFLKLKHLKSLMQLICSVFVCIRGTICKQTEQYFKLQSMCWILRFGIKLTIKYFLLVPANFDQSRARH